MASNDEFRSLTIRDYATKVIRRNKCSTPDIHKDATYWEKRKRNNAAARKSREKRRSHEISAKSRVLELENENYCLKRELLAMRKYYSWALNCGYVCDESHMESDVDIKHESVCDSDSSHSQGDSSRVQIQVQDVSRDQI